MAANTIAETEPYCLRRVPRRACGIGMDELMRQAGGSGLAVECGFEPGWYDKGGSPAVMA